ncbi:MAG: MurR/RpiR family transcriptional regulator [Thomasclavelia sp.]|nr:MurR/RpiR family transcriptional regulator [Thomasclavelia sp.]
MLIEKMTKQLNTYSKGEQEIINYIINNQSEFTNMTITLLASKTYTSNGTIIRLCQKLGFKGYKDFKIEMIKELESKKYLNETIDFSSPFYDLQNTNEIVKNMASLYKESIDVVLSNLDVNKLEKIVNEISEASRVFIYATGDTSITVKAFINKLTKLNIYIINANENGEAIANSINTTSNDLALFISYKGKNVFDKCTSLLKNNGTKIVSITANDNSVISKYSDYTLLISDKEHDSKIATFYSQFVFEYILNTIYALLFSKNYKINNQRKRYIDKLEKEKK